MEPQSTQRTQRGSQELDRITPRNAGIILKILLILSDISLRSPRSLR